MATITSAQSGNWSTGSTWVGGVVPVAGTDKVVVAAGHTVTLDGAITAGDDTVTIGSVDSYSAAAIMVYGTIKAPRNANTSLTCWGDLIVKNNGQLDFGKIGDPIPDGYTFTLYVNRANSPAHGKYGVVCENGGITHFHGAARTRNTTLVNSVAAGATSIDVADATGWKAGDSIFIAPTERSIASITRGEIAVIHASYTTGNTIPLTAGLTYLHDNATPAGGSVAVSNLKSNVQIRNYSDSYKGYVYIRYGSLSSNGEHTYNYVEAYNVHQVTNSDVLRQGVEWLMVNQSVSTPTAIVNSPTGNSFWSNTSGGSAFMRYTDVSPITFINTAIVGITASGSNAASLAAGSVGVFDGLVCANLNGGIALQTSYSQGGQGWTITNFWAYCANGQILGTINVNWALSNGVVAGRGNLTFANALSFAMSNVDCSGLFETNASADKILGNAYNNSVIKATLEDCKFKSDHYIGQFNSGGVTDLGYANVNTEIVIKNRNADSTAQEKWNKQGARIRDNAQLLRSRSSIRFEPKVANRAITETFTVAGAAGIPVSLGFGLRYDSTYGSATPPSVTVSGLGITPVTFTAGGSANTDYEQVITVTPVTTGSLTIAVSGQSTSASGKFWFSGMPVAPWIDWAFHYGYAYNPTSPTLTADSNISASYATAIAYTGLAWDGSTLTISADHSGQELYDWHAAYCATNRLAPFMTGTPSNLVVTGALTFDNAGLTGNGTIDCGANTFTLTGSTTSTWIVKHGAGVRAPISVTGYNAGARLQLYSVTASTELYNDIPAGLTYTLMRNWSSDETIRLRMARVAGTDADALIQTTALFTSAGASFLLSPVPDTVYEANAIDGSTVTEFSADYPNVQIDINDVDGVTTPQRCYAWYMNNQMSAASLAAYHGAITAEDASNYRINTAVANMRAQNVGTNAVVVAGARIYRDDGASIFAPGNGPIQLESGKAYLASGSATAADVAAAVTTLKGSGNRDLTDVYSHELTLAEIEASTVLAKEATVNSRLSASAYTPSPSAADIRAEIDAHSAKLDVAVGTRLSASAYTAPPSAVAIRSEIDTNSVKLDAAVSTRLAAAGYTAPDNAGISAANAAIAGLNDLSAADVRAQTDAALTAYDAPTKAELDALETSLKGVGNKDLTQVFNNTPAIDPSSVWSHPTRTLTAGAGITLAEIEASTVLAKEATVNSRLAASAYTPSPSAADIRAEIDANSAKLDVAVGTRLSASAYTAPDNAGINAALAAVAELNDLSAADVRAQADAALTAYDAPTKAELDAGLDSLPTALEVADAVWSKELP